MMASTQNDPELPFLCPACRRPTGTAMSLSDQVAAVTCPLCGAAFRAEAFTVRARRNLSGSILRLRLIDYQGRETAREAVNHGRFSATHAAWEDLLSFEARAHDLVLLYSLGPGPDLKALHNLTVGAYTRCPDRPPAPPPFPWGKYLRSCLLWGVTAPLLACLSCYGLMLVSYNWPRLIALLPH